MKIALLAFALSLASAPAFADEIVGNLNDNKVIQNQLSARIGEEMNKAISCEVGRSALEAQIKALQAKVDAAEKAKPKEDTAPAAK